MKVEDIVECLTTHGKRKTDPLIWESSLYYFTAILMNKYNFRKIIGSRKSIRYYSIVFAQSGVGKSFSLSTLEKIFHLDNYGQAMKRFFEQSMSMLPESPDDIDEILRYMPKSAITGLEGTKEGLFYITLSQVASNFGSLNIMTEELGESISSSSEVLSKLKEMYDGKYKAKVIKGDVNSSLKDDIDHIICNFIGVGTRKGVTKEAERELNRIATSGMYRRTYIVDSKLYVEKNRDESRLPEVKEYIDELNEKHKDNFMIRREIDFFSETDIFLESGFEERLDIIDDELIAIAANDRLNEFIQYDTGSLEMIIDLAYIISFIEDETKVSIASLNKAYDFFLRTRHSVEETFKTIHPYKVMYELLSKKPNMTISEMAEIEYKIPIAKGQVNDNVALLEELCYRKDEILHKNEGKVVRYRIEALPINKLDKLVLSIHNEGKKEFAINFQPLELTWDQLKDLSKSEKAESFCTAHFSPTAKAPAGHREAKSYIEGANIIAFDIDDGMTIKEAEQLLSEYKYLIYTSKSHNTEKYNFRDRFRILLPTKNKFYVTPDQHKDLYINIEEFLGLKNNDIQTRNTSRLWYTNPNAELFENEGQLLDVTYLLPSTDKSDNYIPKMNEINDSLDDGKLSRREAGYMKYFFMHTSEGNRHEQLTKAAYFFKDLGLDWKDKVSRLNLMLTKPMTEREMKFIYSIK